MEKKRIEKQSDFFIPLYTVQFKVLIKHTHKFNCYGWILFSSNKMHYRWSNQLLIDWSYTRSRLTKSLVDFCSITYVMEELFHFIFICCLLFFCHFSFVHFFIFIMFRFQPRLDFIE